MRSLSDGGEVFVEGEGLFVSRCLYGVGVTELEGWTANETGTSTQGERNGKFFEDFAFVI